MPDIRVVEGRSPVAMTIAEAAVIVLQKHGTDLVVYGDCGLLDEIGRLANMKPTHPLNRHARILDALDRSPLFEKKFGRWSYTNRLCRGFKLRVSAECGI